MINKKIAIFLVFSSIKLSSFSMNYSIGINVPTFQKVNFENIKGKSSGISPICEVRLSVLEKNKFNLEIGLGVTDYKHSFIYYDKENNLSGNIEVITANLKIAIIPVFIAPLIKNRLYARIFPGINMNISVDEEITFAFYDFIDKFEGRKVDKSFAAFVGTGLKILIKKPIHLIVDMMYSVDFSKRKTGVYDSRDENLSIRVHDLVVLFGLGIYL